MLVFLEPWIIRKPGLDGTGYVSFFPVRLFLVLGEPLALEDAVLISWLELSRLLAYCGFQDKASTWYVFQREIEAPEIQRPPDLFGQ